MKHYLFHCSVGPVVQAIQAARRTRDIHNASEIVGELARVACSTLAALGKATLIVPSSFGASDPVSDRILALLETDDPHDLSSRVEDAVRAHWQTQRSQLPEFCRAWGLDVQNEQEMCTQLGLNPANLAKQAAEKDLLEFFSAWVEIQSPDQLHKDNALYASRRTRVEYLLSARETLADFETNPINHAGPKSSLDGTRESLLVELDKFPDAESLIPRRKVGLGPQEHIDFPGLVKRLRTDPQTLRSPTLPSGKYPSVSSLAASPWVRGSQHNPARLAAIEEVSKRLEAESENARLFCSKSRDDSVKQFRFDGAVLYKERRQAMEHELAKLANAAKSPEFAKRVANATKTLKALESPLSVHGIGRPQPYLAVLACDGDGLGVRVGSLGLKQHLSFSKSLSEFATRAAATIRRFHGVPIYYGGDDVLALLPLDQALVCAGELRELFVSLMAPEGVVAARPTGPTLSVGIAVVHMLTPMAGDMIRYAHDAEHHAKEPDPADRAMNDSVITENQARDAALDALRSAKQHSKNALAIHVHKRSGAPVKVRLQWDAGTPPHTRLAEWLSLLENGDLPDRVAYSIAKLGREFTEFGEPTQNLPPFPTPNLLREELRRLLGRKQITGNARTLLDRLVDTVSTLSDLDQLAREIVVARALLGAQKDVRGHSSRSLPTSQNEVTE